MPNGKTLIAGPFVGEFGWELMRWQSYIRAMSEGFDRTIIYSRPDREFLYRDFADEFCPHDPGTSDGSMYSLPKGIGGSGVNLFAERDDSTVRINPQNKASADKAFAGVTPVWTAYGNTEQNGQKREFVCIHARKVSSAWDSKESRNWSDEKWDALVGGMDMPTIAIGHPDQSICPRGAVDSRGSSLESLANTLRVSRCIVGPSSGPMHFASLCGCPQVIWVGKDPGGKLAKRYRSGWNPFDVSVEIVPSDHYWNPSVDDVRDCLYGSRIPQHV